MSRPLRVTVVELPDDFSQEVDEHSWKALCEHTHAHRSQFVLLPELPFSPWLMHDPQGDGARVWRELTAAHERWYPRLGELGADVVALTIPAHDTQGRRRNRAVLWERTPGPGLNHMRSIHDKVYLPDEEGVYEARHYAGGTDSELSGFTVQHTRAAATHIGFLTCSEIWYVEHARRMGRSSSGHTAGSDNSNNNTNNNTNTNNSNSNTSSHNNNTAGSSEGSGVQILLSPRCTETHAKWVAAGVTTAVAAGAYSLSSNRVGGTATCGGVGWIVSPDGEVLGTTDARSPFLTLEIDVALADAAKHTYPRYIPDY